MSLVIASYIMFTSRLVYRLFCTLNGRPKSFNHNLSTISHYISSLRMFNCTGPFPVLGVGPGERTTPLYIALNNLVGAMPCFLIHVHILLFLQNLSVALCSFFKNPRAATVHDG